MKISWIKSNYSLKYDPSEMPIRFHGSKRFSSRFIKMWNDLARSDRWCAIYCSASMDDGVGPRRENSWAEDWQHGMIIGLIRPGGGLRDLPEKDESGKPRWGISGILERVEEFSPSEVVPLKPLVATALGSHAWPSKVQFLLRGAPTKLEGSLTPLQLEIERALAPAIARIEAGRCP